MIDTFLRKPDIRKATGGASDMTVLRWENAGKFPRRRLIGPNICGWLASEVEEWQRTRPADAPRGPKWTLEQRKAAHEKRAATMAARARANKSGSGAPE
jgi:predicted DNA-binding transcriptional regulator AlpA